MSEVTYRGNRGPLGSPCDYSSGMPFDGDSHPEQIEKAVSALLADIDPQVSPFRLRNRHRGGIGRWIVSLAVPSGHAYDLPSLETAVVSLGMLIEGVFEYEGDLRQAIWDDLGEPPVDHDGLPTTCEDQSCAFCEKDPAWVHPFDPATSTFGHHGQRYHLPTFWTICDSCEALYVAGDDARLAAIHHEHDRESPEESAATVAAFRAAETGRRPLAPSRYPLS